MSEEHAVDPDEERVQEELEELDAELGVDEDESPETELDTGEEASAPEPSAEPEPPAGAPSREQRRIRALREHRRIRALRERERTAQEEVRRLRQQNEQLLTQFRQPQQQPDPYRQQLEAQQEQERLQMMQPHEAAAYVAQREARQLRQEMASQNIQNADRLDQLMFQQKHGATAIGRRLATRVEETLIQARQAGMNPTREWLLKALVGDEVLTKTEQQTARQQRNGARRIAAQTTQPGTPRSNAPAARGGRRAADDSDEALIARLKSVTIGEVW